MNKNVYKVDPQSPLYRFAEITIPLAVWATITMPIWLSPFHPAVASYFILGYMIFFLYKAVKTMYYATVSLRLMKRAEEIDWYAALQKEKSWDEIQHVALIVNYKESAAKLRKTLHYLQDQKYDLKNTHVVLGMELREGESARKRSDEILTEFKDVFGSIHTTYHELVEGEAIGKASNATFASKFISKLAEERGWDKKKVIITVCDADSLLPDQYMSYVSVKYLNDKDSPYYFFSGPVLLYNHFWELPLPIRMQTILSSVSRFAYLSQHEDLIQISTYSMSLWLLEEVGYWDTDIIPEDWHLWMQAFYTLGEKVKTVPVYLLIVRDGVLADTLIKSFKTRYEQEKRWAWGVSDVPYSIVRFFHSPHINIWVKLRRLYYVTEIHFLWPTSAFILTIGASIPPLVNPVFQRTVLGFLLPKLSSAILSLATVSIFAMLYFDYKLRETVKIKTSLRNMPIMFVQWIFLPIISFVFSSIPALESHTRMLLGKKLEYKVTEKITTR